MSERLGGGYEPQHYAHSGRPLSFEQRETLNNILLEIDKLLAKIVEQGGDLPGDIKQAIRAKIQAYLQMLGQITGIAMEGIEDLAKVYDWTAAAANKMPVPADYPSEYAFEQALSEVVANVGAESLPSVPRRISATQVADFAQSDWSVVTGRSRQETASYLYNLGILMSDGFAYRNIFSGRSDDIVIGHKWSVENGRHRALALRALGEGYVDSVGMDGWVTVDREA